MSETDVGFAPGRDRAVHEDIRTRSPILKEMEDAGKIKIAGATYDMDTGEVEFLA